MPRRAQQLALLLAAGLITVLTAGRARAAVELVPAEDGSLGAWLVAGAVPANRGEQIDAGAAEPVEGARLADAGWAPSWRIVSTDDGAIDLEKELSAGKKAGPWAMLGGELVLPQDLDGWLLLSFDGGATAFVDGKQLWSRDLERIRGQSWDAIPLRLSKGRHRLALLLHHRGRYWAAAARVVERATLRPPRGLSLLLPGTDAADASRLAEAMLHVELGTGLEADGYHPRIALEYRNGAPRAVPREASVQARLVGSSQPLFKVDLGALPIGERSVHALRAELPPIPTSALGKGDGVRRLELEIRLGKVEIKRTLLVTARAPRVLARAQALALSLRQGAHKLLDAAVVADTLEQQIGRLGRLGHRKRSTQAALDTTLGGIEALCSSVEHGADPLTQPGVHALARVSDLDGHPQRFELYVPGGFDPHNNRHYPLVVALHGYNGAPHGVMRAFLDTDSHGPVSGVGGFVLAPFAHGNAFYRGPGEHEVMRSLDWAMKTYPIDPERVSITGVSMGGTGAAQLAFLYADHFSAVSPLCGYQSFFIRHDTSHRPLRPWEKDRMRHWSPTSWAENGRNMPMFLAQGTKDYPHANGKVLVKRYRELGYSVSEDWPDIGHHVWEIEWKGAKGWPWLAGHRHDPSAPHITLKTDQLRYGKLDWLRITLLQHPGRMGLVDARVVDTRHVVVKTEAVDALSIDRAGAKLAADAPVAMEIDGRSLTFKPTEPVAAHRTAKRWQSGAASPAPGEKRAGLEGPIRDAFLGPLAFVYGTLDPSTARANREVAAQLAEVQFGEDIHYPVVADRSVGPELERTHSLFLVGTGADNLVLRSLDAQLPVHVKAGVLYLGTHHYAGRDLGAIFIHPNPRHPDRYVVAVEAVDAAGIWEALSLPRLLPDFVVYDAGLAAASGQQVLGSAHVLAGGFFKRDWSVPARVADPMTVTSAPTDPLP